MHIVVRASEDRDFIVPEIPYCLFWEVGFNFIFRLSEKGLPHIDIEFGSNHDARSQHKLTVDFISVAINWKLVPERSHYWQSVNRCLIKYCVEIWEQIIP